MSMKRLWEWIKNWFIQWEKEQAAIDSKPKPTEEVHTPGVPHIIVSEIKGATPAEITMIHDGLKFLNNIIAGYEFKQKVLEAQFTETNKLSNAQIYEKFCSKVVTVKIVVYTGTWWANHVSKTIGYENEPGVIYVNRYFVNTSYLFADNLIHEGLGHSLDFSHYQTKSTSVPYQLNKIFEAIADGK